jgi:hypothetical protein
LATSALHSFLIRKSGHLEGPLVRADLNGGGGESSFRHSTQLLLLWRSSKKTHLKAHHGKGECIESNSCGPEATKLQESQFLGPTDQARHHSAFGQDKKKIPAPCWAIQIIQQPLSELLPACCLCCWRCRRRQKYIHQMYELDHVSTTSCSKMRLRAPHRQKSTTTLTTCYFVNLISGPDYFDPLFPRSCHKLMHGWRVD